MAYVAERVRAGLRRDLLARWRAREPSRFFWSIGRATDRGRGDGQWLTAPFHISIGNRVGPLSLLGRTAPPTFLFWKKESDPRTLVTRTERKDHMMNAGHASGTVVVAVSLVVVEGIAGGAASAAGALLAVEAGC